jgi:pyruvate kinase
MRSTKIVATLGPASDPLIDEFVAAGVDVFRLNFSHGSHDEHARRITKIRESAHRQKRFVAILADLQGPKIRLGRIESSTLALECGTPFQIDPHLDIGDGTHVGTTYPQLAEDVGPGDVLVIGDGTPELTVKDKVDGKINCVVTTSGTIGSGKGINLKGGGLSAEALTDKDLCDLEFICKSNAIDYVAVSFVRDAADIQDTRARIKRFGGSCGVIAKLERAEAVATDKIIDDIIKASDAVMVARGDLGIEIGDAALMSMQKHIINRARELNRSVITATHMMESMVTSPQPTRAEVMDVANAVLDGTDAVMLSAETAVGKYPVDTVRRMHEVIIGAETSDNARHTSLFPYECHQIDESIAMATMALAHHLNDVAAVICLTATGNTPKLMSRNLSRLPIYALANNEHTLGRIALIRGIHPRLFLSEKIDYDLINQSALTLLKKQGSLSFGDRIVLSKGDYHNVQGGTNTINVLEVA